jgi:hypothetical protein
MGSNPQAAKKVTEQMAIYRDRVRADNEAIGERRLVEFIVTGRDLFAEKNSKSKSRKK